MPCACFFEALSAAGHDSRALAGATVAAIGPGTVRALARGGIRADIVPERFVAESLVEALAGVEVDGRRCSSPAPPRPATSSPTPCSSAAPRSTSSPSTRPCASHPTRPPSRTPRRPTTSPSPPPRPSPTSPRRSATASRSGARVVSIGPITSEAAREAGLEVAVEADPHDVDGLLAALLDDATCTEADRPAQRFALLRPYGYSGTPGVIEMPRDFRPSAPAPARTDSTNTRARELADAGAPHGTVVTAAEQTAGRGRQGRTWTAPPRALLYSAIVRPLAPRHLMLPLAVPIAVCQAAEALRPGIACNQVAERHLARRPQARGILIEARPQDAWAVIGVGLNLFIAPDEFPPELRDTAVSFSARRVGGSTSGRPGTRRSAARAEAATLIAGCPPPKTRCWPRGANETRCAAARSLGRRLGSPTESTSEAPIVRVADGDRAPSGPARSTDPFLSRPLRRLFCAGAVSVSASPLSRFHWARPALPFSVRSALPDRLVRPDPRSARRRSAGPGFPARPSPHLRRVVAGIAPPPPLASAPPPLSPPPRFDFAVPGVSSPRRRLASLAVPVARPPRRRPPPAAVLAAAALVAFAPPLAAFGEVAQQLASDAEGFRAIRIRAPRSTSSPSGCGRPRRPAARPPGAGPVCAPRGPAGGRCGHGRARRS